MGGEQGFFINIFYALRMVLGSLPALFQSTLEPTYIYIPYFINEKIEAQKNQVPYPKFTALLLSYQQLVDVFNFLSHLYMFSCDQIPCYLASSVL